MSDVMDRLLASDELSIWWKVRRLVLGEPEESKRLPDGGWPAEERFYQVTKDPSGRGETVSWGKISKTRMNEWVTADALCVLKAASRDGD